MKSAKSSKAHEIILTCLGLFFGLLLTSFNPQKAFASCSGVDTGSSFTCTLSNGTSVYCANNAECVSYKAQNLPASGTTYNPTNLIDKIFKPKQRYFPDQGCSEGINTALGCLPYTMDNLGPTLFGFLVGFAGMIALFLMLFAASLYITSAGDHEKLKKAKELFTAAVTGLLFIIFSAVLLRMTAGDILKIPGF